MIDIEYGQLHDVGSSLLFYYTFYTLFSSIPVSHSYFSHTDFIPSPLSWNIRPSRFKYTKNVLGNVQAKRKKERISIDFSSLACTPGVHARPVPIAEQGWTPCNRRGRIAEVLRSNRDLLGVSGSESILFSFFFFPSFSFFSHVNARGGIVRSRCNHCGSGACFA